MSDAILAPTAAPPRAPGIWRQSWYRFRRNRAGMIGLCIVTLVVLLAILAPFIAPYVPDDTSAMLRGAARRPPSALHWLGTDRNGYDVFTRTLYGARTALMVGLGAMLIASVIGVLIGGIAGFSGGLVDELLMRFAEFFMVIPVFVVILAVVRLFGIVVVGTWMEDIPNLNMMTIIVLLGCFEWPPIARMARAEFLRLRGAEFVEAAHCIGSSRRDILLRHILPNAMPPLIVLVALGIGGAILAETMVSFLGFGDPKAVSWGQSLFFNYEALKVAPWAVLSPGAALFVTVLGFNLLADGLTDAFNPRLRQ
ncbi:ABC transporter permease [Rhodovarius crocodyli]|uniref:ABC transporter permease n=1 Tax=Rhodovarius crocodyli TaxID=1979269 RepID=A0A437MNT7_9PROT|nr:ABC transporter permease [Rhodovarius crocodyli]RVT99303.1 ABC transporter permease [Rhodovarius crocodyli]